MVLLLIIACTLLTGAGAVALAGATLLLSEPARKRLTPLAVSYATGTLLGAALLGLLPHALAKLSAPRVLATVLAGIIAFFILEKLAIWRHCHVHKCEFHSSAGRLILIGDSLHNFVDGVAIAVGFVTSVPMGIAASVAVASHEIPQEIGDFFILLDSGFTRGKAFAYNLLSGLAVVVGGVLAYAWVSMAGSVAPYITAFSAASFVYIALADLIPGHRQETNLRSIVQQLGLILAGISTIVLLHGAL